MRRVIPCIFFIFLTSNLFAQIPEVESAKDVITAVNNILRVKRILELPHDTICTASVGSIAEMDGVAYIKDVMYWKPIGANSLTGDISFKWAVIDSLNTPSGSAVAGDKFLVGDAPAGAFAGNAKKIAVLYDAGYQYQTPVEGDMINIASTGWIYKWSGTTWVRQGRAVVHQGGDAIKNILYIGTKDGYSLRLQTNGIDRLRFSAAGDVVWPKLTGTDTGFVLLGPGGGMIRKELSASSDTSTYKPMAINTKGQPVRMNSWPATGGANAVGYGLLIDSSKYKADTTKLQTKLGWFDVVSYGADSTGNIDATAAIQAAINAANAHGGGVVYFRNGTYKIGGALQTNVNTSVGIVNMNSQIYIPTRPRDTLRSRIVLLGETPPNMKDAGRVMMVNPSIRGVILKSTLTTGTVGGAVIGTSGRDNGYLRLNYNELTVKNISIQVKSNITAGGPAVGGISYKNGVSLTVEDVVVTIDTMATLSAAPTNLVSGIEGPDNNAETNNNIINTNVVGFKNGFLLGEHCVLNNAESFNCESAFNFKGGGHPNWAGRLLSQWCKYDITFLGAATVSISQLAVEWAREGKWYDNAYTINDLSNLGAGTIYYSIAQGSYGKNNNLFSANGATNVNYASNDDALAVLRKPNIFTATQTISGLTGIGLLINNTGSNQARIGFQRSGVTKFGIGMDVGIDGTNDFFINDNINSKTRFYISPDGTVNIGGAANAISTSAISINNAGSISFMNNKLFVDGSNGYIGINTITPNSELEVVENLNSSSRGITASGFGATNAALMFFKRARGSYSTPSAMANGDNIGFFRTQVYDGTSFLQTAYFGFLIDGNVSSNSAPTAFVIGTGSSSFGTERWRVDNTGNFSNTGTTGSAYITLKSGTTTAGTAPLKLTTGSKLTTPEVGAIEYNTPQLLFTNGGGQRQELVQTQQSRVSSQFNTTNNGLSAIPSLTANVVAGKTYRFEANLYTTSNASAGVKTAIGGTASATSIIYEALATDAGITTQGRGTAIAMPAAAVTSVSAAYIVITGTITVASTGTITVQFAQNVSNTLASTVLPGSTFVVSEML